MARLGASGIMQETSDTVAPGEQAAVRIIYDGECPFCSAYVRIVRLQKAAGRVDLVNARTHPAMTREFLNEGIDLNQTMVVQYGGQTYAGAEAVQILSLLSSKAGLMNRMMAGILRDHRRARVLYPVLRAGRNLTLRLLGRPKLETHE